MQPSNIGHSLPTENSPDVDFMKLQKISESCFAILNEKNRLCDANSGFIHRGGGMLVDTQCDLSHARQMMSLIADVDSTPPRYVVNTHEDADHVWGNQLFPESEIIAHQSVPQRMRDVADPEPIRKLDRSIRNRFTRQILRWLHPGLFAVGTQLQQDYNFDEIELVFPTRLFDEQLGIDLDGLAVHLLYVGPCHQVGDVIVHVPEEEVVFAGDIVFQECTPIGWAGTCENWMAALDLSVELKPKTIVPGHGPTCDADGAREMRGYLEYTWGEAKRCFEKGISSVEAAKEIEFGRFRSWHSPARLYMIVERAYRELRGEPLDQPWSTLKSFDSIYQVAKSRGLELSF